MDYSEVQTRLLGAAYQHRVTLEHIQSENRVTRG